MQRHLSDQVDVRLHLPDQGKQTQAKQYTSGIQSCNGQPAHQQLWLIWCIAIEHNQQDGTRWLTSAGAIPYHCDLLQSISSLADLPILLLHLGQLTSQPCPLNLHIDLHTGSRQAQSHSNGPSTTALLESPSGPCAYGQCAGPIHPLQPRRHAATCNLPTVSVSLCRFCRFHV